MPITIKQLPPSDRPRERLRHAGEAALSDVELITLLFGGNLDLATAIVARVGGAAGLRRAVVGELCAIPGVGVARACQLRAAVELGLRAAAAGGPTDAPLTHPWQAHERLRGLARLEHEELHAIALDSRHRVLAQYPAASGALNVVHLTPRDVFRRAIREGAASVIVAHNHPSGDVLPSEDDVALTRRLRTAGELVGVALLDHLIVAGDAWYSFSEGRMGRRTPPPE